MRLRFFNCRGSKKVTGRFFRNCSSSKRLAGMRPWIFRNCSRSWSFVSGIMWRFGLKVRAALPAARGEALAPLLVLREGFLVMETGVAYMAVDGRLIDHGLAGNELVDDGAIIYAVSFSPELAVSTIAALAGLWQVYVAKQALRGVSGKQFVISFLKKTASLRDGTTIG